MEKYGIFLARLQPIHNAHIYMIETILKECDHCVIIIGSSNKEGTLRNPFTACQRKQMLSLSIAHLDTSRITILTLPDWETEENSNHLGQWGHFLYYNIVSQIQCKDMTFYYADEAEYLKSWFDEEINSHISYRFMERSTIFNGLSATKIREALIQHDMEYLNEYLPKPLHSFIGILSQQLQQIQENPKDDFSM